MPHDLNDLYYFAKVVECGGFAAAGRETGIPKSRLSRRIAELEERLQVRLLHRTTRKLALTEVGERYLQHCRNLLLEAEMAEQVIAELSVEPRGRLRLSAPVAMASSNLADLLPRFLERHPQVQLEILLTNRRVDLLNEGVDVVLRVRELGDEDPALVCRRLAPATTQILAAPSLIAGRRLEHPEDLEDLPFLGAIHNDRKVHATLIGPDGSRYQLEREPRLGVDDFVLRKKAAVAGLGVTLLPEGYCDRELADGSLVRILPQWTLPKSTMQAAYLPRSSQIPAIRALIDFLVEALQRPSGETGPAYRRARE
ncbi:TPA: LysR family transcriptional regulator [Pseudomonas aeruginosa]|nr:LysR family transcriptional regulator [Pseudomonas aeruginosa]